MPSGYRHASLRSVETTTSVVECTRPRRRGGQVVRSGKLDLLKVALNGSNQVGPSHVGALVEGDAEEVVLGPGDIAEHSSAPAIFEICIRLGIPAPAERL